MEKTEVDNRYLELQRDFEVLGSWSMRYQSLIEMGRDMSEFPAEYKTQEFYVEGCLSALWIRGEYRDGLLWFTADSVGILPKGLAALLVHLFNGVAPQEILGWTGSPSKELGFYQNMTPTRVEAFTKMITRFKKIAQEAVVHPEKSRG